jgi:hypothetical protein
MRNQIKYIIFAGLSVFFSCEKMVIYTNCSECVANEPKETSLEIVVDGAHSDYYPTIVRVYEGIIEDNILRSTHTLSGPNLYVSVWVNKKYTITATYTEDNGSVFIAVDSATPKAQYESKKCQNPCYFIYDKKVDLRLKYSK